MARVLLAQRSPMPLPDFTGCLCWISGQRGTSRLQMVSTLETAAAVADSRHAYPALAAWARLAAGDLRPRWPDANADLPALPAYTRRG